MIHEIQQGFVKTELHQGIITIEFFHPQGNSLPGKILEELAKEIHIAGNNDDCKVIVLKSAGDKTFCSGASFDELEEIKTEAEGLRFFTGFANVINAMRKCPKFIIGRIQGRCVGGGVGLVAACDYAIAKEGADLKLSELAFGIGPFVIGPVVEKRAGTAAFNQLAIDAASWRSADWAKRKGLYAEVHPSQESLDDAVMRLSLFLTHSNPHAMAELKKAFWKGAENWDELLKERAAISGKLILSSFTKKFIQEFKERQAAKNKSVL